MEINELKKIWNTLAHEKLIDRSLARENILEIITQKGNGVINKLQRKHRRDFNGYLGVVILIPFGILFLLYRDSQGLIPPNSSLLGGPYLIPCLIEAFMIYCLMSIRNNLNFLKITYNTDSLKESLVNVKSYFKRITGKGFWIGTISLMAILAFIEVDTLVKIGGVKNINIFTGPYLYESYFSIFLLILIVSIPYLVRQNAKRYAEVLHDLDQTLEELNEENNAD